MSRNDTPFTFRFVLAFICCCLGVILISGEDRIAAAEPQIDRDTEATVVALRSAGEKPSAGIVLKGGLILTSEPTVTKAIKTEVRAGEWQRRVTPVTFDHKTGFGLLQMHGIIPPTASLDRSGKPPRGNDFIVCPDESGPGHTIATFSQFMSKPGVTQALERGRDLEAFRTAKTRGACGIFDAKTRKLKTLFACAESSAGGLVRLVPIAALRELLKEVR